MPKKKVKQQKTKSKKPGVSVKKTKSIKVKKTRKITSKKIKGIDIETVMHVAKASRIELTPQEAKKYQKDLSDILLAFKDLNKVKANVSPSFHPLDVKDVVREDKEEPSLPREKALKNAKHKEDGYFKGPRAV